MNCPLCGTQALYVGAIGLECGMPGCANAAGDAKHVPGSFEWAQEMYLQGWDVEYFNTHWEKWVQVAPSGASGWWFMADGAVQWRKHPLQLTPGPKRDFIL